MGAELGVTTSIFPSDEQTRTFLTAQDRADSFQPLAADPDAQYDRVVKINLDQLTPLAAGPSSPDNILEIADLDSVAVHQVLIGSCTNSSYRDLMTVAAILKNRTVHPDVELGIAPGSRQVINLLAQNGALSSLVSSGARILESSCGPCIGQGQSPGQNKVSVRTFNRNFKGRTGTPDDQVYLTSPEAAAAAALTGKLTDPRMLTGLFNISYPHVTELTELPIDDNMIQPPAEPADALAIKIIRADTIVTPPAADPPPENLDGTVLLRCADKITTDHIMPAGTFLKLRSNVPEYAKVVFNCFNEPGQPTFADRALEIKNAGRHGIIVAGDSYGQGSSREHAALCPMYLGLKLVIAKTIERIHCANLINFAIIPASFADPADYDSIDKGDELTVTNLSQAISDADTFTVKNRTKDSEFTCRIDLSERDRRILLAGGKLNYTRDNS